MARISIVTSLYYSASYIQPFFDQMLVVLSTITADFEIIFVNDGSPDESSSIVKKLIALDSRVKLIDLSRNFGHSAAIYSGLENARGELVYVTDIDLEEPPETLKLFYDILTTELELDVVYGYMINRKGNYIEKFFGSVFYKVINTLSDVYIPENQLWARLMSRKYVNNLLKFKEYNFYFAGVFQLVGFNQKGISIVKSSKGTTVYSFTKKISQALLAVVSFSSKPLIYIAMTGFIFALFGFTFGLYLIISKIFFLQLLPGWTSLIASIWFIGGFTIACIGVVGYYVATIYSEVKERPRAIIKNKF